MLARNFWARLLGRRGLSGPQNVWRTRPFELRDLAGVPDNYRVGPPDFVGIGAVRSGTTWWYQLLIEHPSVRPNRLAQKELSFFFHFGSRPMDTAAVSAYRQAFAAPRGCICGEWTPGYLCYPLAVGYLAEAAPAAKLLAIVRNPVDRLFSALNHRSQLPNASLGLKGTRAYLLDTFSVFQVLVAHSLYAQAFRHVLQRFDRSRLLVLQYEQCVREPAAQIARTYRFLALDDSFVPPSLNRRLNAVRYRAEPDPRYRGLLVDYFRDDVRALFDLFPELDRSLWSDFAQ